MLPPVVSPTIAPVMPSNVNGMHNLPSSHLGSMSFSPGSDKHRPKDKNNFGRQKSYPACAGAVSQLQPSSRQAEHCGQTKESSSSRATVGIGEQKVLQSLSEHDSGHEEGIYIHDSDDIYNHPTNNARVQDLYENASSSQANWQDYKSQEDTYDVPPSSVFDDVYDVPPPSAHLHKESKPHSYVNAPTIDCPNHQLVSQSSADETYDKFPSNLPCKGSAKSDDSYSSDDDAEAYEEYGQQVDHVICVSSRTRSFRSSINR